MLKNTGCQQVLRAKHLLTSAPNTTIISEKLCLGSTRRYQIYFTYFYIFHLMYICTYIYIYMIPARGLQIKFFRDSSSSSSSSNSSSSSCCCCWWWWWCDSSQSLARLSAGASREAPVDNECFQKFADDEQSWNSGYWHSGEAQAPDLRHHGDERICQQVLRAKHLLTTGVFQQSWRRAILEYQAYAPRLRHPILGALATSTLG